MNNQNEEVETGVSPYVPSARKSIHSHNSCIFPYGAEMGRYGLDSRPVLNPSGSVSHQDFGTDEVDNVMSKFTRQTSPVPVRKKRIQKKQRRNSLQDSEPELSDDSDSESTDIAHRSLPNDVFRNKRNITSESVTDNREQNTSKEYYSHGTTSTSKSFNEYQNQKEQHNKRQNGKSCQSIVLMLAVAILSVAAFFCKDFLNNYLAQETNSIYDESKFSKDMKGLGDKYNIHDTFLLEVHSGISTILDRNDTGSFIFVYNEKSEKFNYLQFSNFMKDITLAAAQYLRNDTKYIQPTVLHSYELDMQSYGELMKKYRHEVAKTGVMLVQDIDKVPSSLAMAFHYFCDEQNPLVAKSAIFFTLNLTNCSHFTERKWTHNDVEKCLAKIWSTVPKDNIKPLLARVVNVVIDITDIML